MDIHEKRAVLAEAEAAIIQAQAALETLRGLIEDDAPVSPDEHARLNEMIAAGMADVAAGRVVDGDVAFARIDARLQEAARKRQHA